MHEPKDDAGPTFIQVAEVWVPKGDRLVFSSGAYGKLDDFAAVSGRESFARGEGLPGKAWAEARPVVLKTFEGSYFKRTDAAKAAGLTCAVAIPVFAGDVLKAVLVVMCHEDAERRGAIEIWHESDGILLLDDGYYGAAKEFEWVSKHVHFPRGQGLPGGVWASRSPMLMRDLGSSYAFIRADAAGKAGLTTGLGMPVPGGATYVLTLLSARGTPIARRFEIWDARPAVVGKTHQAILIDGICAREGRLWTVEGAKPRTVPAWQGVVGQALGSGVPVVESHQPILTAGYDTMVALPIHRERDVAYVVAWYF